MDSYTILAVSISFIYTFSILALTIGYLNIKRFNIHPGDHTEDLFMSVIIAVKNEEKHILSLIENLENQSQPKSSFEVIFVNDGSSDRSEIILGEAVKRSSLFSLITLEAGKHGKKHALEAGIEKARGKLIVTTDADCANGPNWLRSIALFYTRKKPKLIIGPVKMKGKGFFEQFQSLEFLSLVASGAGAAGLGRPIMCNGANLAYEKDAFNELDDAFQMNEYSGDDVFLLHRMKAKYKKDISFLKSEDAMVFTESPPTLKAFFKQRTRWASKSKSYKDADTIIISLLVLLINLSIILSFTAAFFEQQALRYAVILFTSKFLSDLILLTVSSKFYKSTHLLSLYFLWAPVYPLYIVVAASYTIFSWFLKKR